MILIRSRASQEPASRGPAYKGPFRKGPLTRARSHMRPLLRSGEHRSWSPTCCCSCAVPFLWECSASKGSWCPLGGVPPSGEYLPRGSRLGFPAGPGWLARVVALIKVSACLSTYSRSTIATGTTSGRNDKVRTLADNDGGQGGLAPGSCQRPVGRV